jgi:G:T/U-mismatch repair DNA glycosylase
MFYHKHPYPPFIPKNATKLIVGTLPPPRFSTGQLKDGDVNFCYGSRDGLLWPAIDSIFDLNLLYNNSDKAVMQRKTFLTSRGIGICDIVESCERIKVDASDLGMLNIVLRDLLRILAAHPDISTILFTGGNSKNGPEYLFRRHLRSRSLKLLVRSEDLPKIHEFEMPGEDRLVTTVSMVAPSGSANRAIGALDYYKSRKKHNPEYNTLEFRKEQYQKFL